MKTIHSYQVVYHGFENSQYFQGCGSGLFENVVTGCGFSIHEAFNDALEMMAQTDNLNLDYIEENEKRKKPEDETVYDFLKTHGELINDEIPEDCEIYCYVSIRWNTIETMAKNLTK